MPNHAAKGGEGKKPDSCQNVRSISIEGMGVCPAMNDESRQEGVLRMLLGVLLVACLH